MAYQCDEKENEEKIEQNLRNASSGDSNAAKSQDGSDNRDDEEA